MLNALTTFAITMDSHNTQSGQARPCRSDSMQHSLVPTSADRTAVQERGRVMCSPLCSLKESQPCFGLLYPPPHSPSPPTTPTPTPPPGQPTHPTNQPLHPSPSPLHSPPAGAAFCRAGGAHRAAAPGAAGTGCHGGGGRPAGRVSAGRACMPLRGRSRAASSESTLSGGCNVRCQIKALFVVVSPSHLQPW